jgi:PleD family two-component response regulator
MSISSEPPFVRRPVHDYRGRAVCRTKDVDDGGEAGREIRYARSPMPRSGLFSVGSLAGVHVLLIDDDPASREELAAILRYCGALLTVAHSEAEGLRVLDFIHPNVIVLGVARRHRGELPFVRRLRNHGSQTTATIPIIAIVWPDDVVSVAGATVVQLRRPLEAWEVCRALATAVNVE